MNKDKSKDEQQNLEPDRGYTTLPQNLGNVIGGALGAEDALQAQERRIQEAIQQYKSVCERCLRTLCDQKISIYPNLYLPIIFYVSNATNGDFDWKFKTCNQHCWERWF